MTYANKNLGQETKTDQQSAYSRAIPSFTDQRTSTSVQLKQQQMMRSAHLPNVIQQLSAEEDEPLQGEFENEASVQLKEASAETPNNTGLPDNLKSGIESLSGYSMDNVKVHYNSDKPAQLNAHAYAQGTDIHVAPGQEQHLPHEAWHVVQQKQGRVQPTMQMKAGVPVNDDVGLENEADVMGARALGIVGDVTQRLERENTQLKNADLSSGEMVKVAQLTDVTEIGVDDDPGLTPDKKIKPRNSSEAWYRFPKDGYNIDTFASNKTTSSPKGNTPVAHGKAFDLDNDAKLSQEDIGSLSRAQHFAAGDRLAGSSASSRKGKWTWHHKQDPYYMELVDMAVHKSFYHHGGFSKWQEGADDDEIE